MKHQRVFVIGVIVLLAASALACALPGSTPAATVEAPAGGTVEALGGQRIEQWASGASASSEYGNPDWAAIQATGAPDSNGCSDLHTAWASSTSDSPDEWLELSYVTPVLPEEIRIYESYNPGSIIRVEVITVVSEYIIVWEDGPRTNENCPHVLTIPIEGINDPVTGVRISLDQSVIGNWDEIDAVQLIGKAAN